MRCSTAWARWRPLCRNSPASSGCTCLQHAPPPLAATTEQQIRGNADRAADAVIVACGYDLAALRALADAALDDTALQAWGALPGSVRQLYGLAYSATPPDVH